MTTSEMSIAYNDFVNSKHSHHNLKCDVALQWFSKFKHFKHDVSLITHNHLP